MNFMVELVYKAEGSKRGLSSFGFYRNELSNDHDAMPSIQNSLYDSSKHTPSASHPFNFI
jgi:hypothetical protein